ncbi:hypothetical protein [Streptomyces sp. SID5910]|uniref:hypothetical protein n=1 Tax=Streptomyces sp. SID5910 TaxID=2690312 RepID=UPI00136F6777|nr:hypothetical protein [Streptomyces sp. SID5910]MYR40888.1 hypothetical protein [Streptomyces sp. SID5910]
MSPFTASTRRRSAGVATAVLLSLGLLTACGSGSSDAGPSRPSASRTAEAPTGSPGAGAQGSEGGELNFQQGEPLTPRQFQLSVDGGTETLTEVSGLTMDQPTEQDPSDGYRLIPGEQPQSGTVTVTRGTEQSQQFTDLIDGKTQPGSASLNQLDFAGNLTKQFTLQEPRVIRVESNSTQSVTIHFTSLSVG